jgi:hypothetical protein
MGEGRMGGKWGKDGGRAQYEGRSTKGEATYLPQSTPPAPPPPAIPLAGGELLAEAWPLARTPGTPTRRPCQYPSQLLYDLPRMPLARLEWTLYWPLPKTG